LGIHLNIFLGFIFIFVFENIIDYFGSKSNIFS
jgi:hypothetical protein